MIIKQSTLRSARTRGFTKEYYSTKSAAAAGKTTAFLSHSHKDQELAEGLQAYLKERGWNVYIDWLDEEMPEKISSETAEKIKIRIRACQVLLFLATDNSCNRSRWCPWEIGLADGEKGASKVLIVPTSDDRGYEFGNEYLGVYKRITEEFNTDQSSIGAAVMQPDNRGIWLKSFQV